MKQTRIIEFEALRVWAMMMVFLSHTSLYPAGGMGAMTFFVLGGFCMTLGYRDKILSSQFNYLNFVKNRILKLIPLHWITLLVAVLLQVNDGSFTLSRKLIANFMLLQSWVPKMDYYFSFNAVAWYLSTLMLFIVLFPAMILLIEKMTQRQRTISFLILMGGYLALLFSVPKSMYHPIIYISPMTRMIDSLVGVALAYFFTAFKSNSSLLKYGKSPFSIVVVVVVIGLMIIVNLISSKTLRCVSGIYWLPISIVIITMAMQHETSNKSAILRFIRLPWVQRLCMGTFSFYLIHQLVIIQLRQYIQLNTLCLTIVALFISYILAQISYLLIEKKLTTMILNFSVNPDSRPTVSRRSTDSHV